MRVLAACAIIGVCLAGAAAQEPQPGQPAYKSRSDLVVLHVSVIDRKAGPVPGLARTAFSVYENGVKQEITFFDHEDSPAAVGLVIDSSMSMQRKRQAIVAAGVAFAESTNPEDQLFTVHFNERVWFGLPEGQAFTSNRGELRTALLRSTARGQSAVYDAIAAALDHVAGGRTQKKALIVISDGGDNASRRSLADVLSAAERSEAIVYTVCLTDEYDRGADPEVLEKFARASGGLSFRPDTVDEVTAILRRVARDLHSGYTISYAPSRAAADSYRNIRVEVAAAGRGKLIVRSRTGYATN